MQESANRVIAMRANIMNGIGAALWSVPLLLCVLFIGNGAASTFAASSVEGQSTKADCSPRWSLKWEDSRSNIPGPLDNLAVVSPNDIWAIGSFSTMAMHWNGAQWSPSYTPNVSVSNNKLPAIAAVSANDIWAVGWYVPVGDLRTSDGFDIIDATLIEHWDGMQWSIVPSPSPGAESALFAVSVVARNDIWAVGTTREKFWKRPLALHWDGIEWKEVSLPSLSDAQSSTARLNSIVAIKANDVWAVGTQEIDADGFGGETLIMHWDGRRWSESTRFGQGRLVAVAALRPNDIWAVGFDTNSRRHEASYSKTMILHWNGTRWRRVLSPTPDDTRCTGCRADDSVLFGIIPIRANEVWALGSQFTNGIKGNFGTPFLLKWDGVKWSIASEPATGFSPNDLNEVGLSAKGHDLGLSGSGWYQPELMPSANGACKGVPSLPKDAAARVAKPKSSAIRYFDAAGHTLRGGFKEYWQTQGGLAQFGYPITEEFEEGGYTVQYFERARFEWHPELALPYSVKLAPLTSNVVESRLISDPFRPQSALPQVGARYIPETMHNLGTQFEDYWQSHGGAGVFGYPISEPFREVNAADGKEYLVQYFPRQRLEYHPELPEPYKVSLGLVGVEYAREQGWLR